MPSRDQQEVSYFIYLDFGIWKVIQLTLWFLKKLLFKAGFTVFSIQLVHSLMVLNEIVYLTHMDFSKQEEANGKI